MAAAGAVAARTPGTSAAVAAAPLDPLRLQTQLLRAHANVAEEDGWALMARVAQYVRANQSDAQHGSLPGHIRRCHARPHAASAWLQSFRSGTTQ
jgi:hypothetical protein